jgi:large subunit ribosomal protein L31e
MSVERVYTINIKDARYVPRIHRARTAVSLVRRFLEKHMKGDVVMSQALNEFIWADGMKKPPTRVKVKVVKDGNIVKADLLGPETPRVRATKSTKKGVIGSKRFGKKDDSSAEVKEEAPKKEAEPKTAKAKKE